MPALLRDAHTGVIVTGRLLRRVARRPFGLESSDWRSWLYPAYVAVLALAPLVGATLGVTERIPAVLVSLALGMLAIVMLARLARRYERDYPSA